MPTDFFSWYFLVEKYSFSTQKLKEEENELKFLIISFYCCHITFRWMKIFHFDDEKKKKKKDRIRIAQKCFKKKNQTA